MSRRTTKSRILKVDYKLFEQPYYIKQFTYMAI